MKRQLACGACGETFREGQQIAEIYDPMYPLEESDIVHEDCIPEGWEIA